MYNLSADYMYHIIIRSKNQCQSEDIFFHPFLIFDSYVYRRRKRRKKRKRKGREITDGSLCPFEVYYIIVMEYYIRDRYKALMSSLVASFGLPGAHASL